MHKDLREMNEKIKHASAFIMDIINETDKVIVGQRAMLERLLIGLLANGHILIEGVPGLAKTLMVKTLAAAIKVKFQRIQFTPDLLPADIIGTLVFDPKQQEFTAKPGPIFASLILADEINRAPAKVQSALLEAMQERQVTIGDTTYPLPEPFLVLATQNPIEHEGTYPLPEAQIDRFMLKIKVTYPFKDEEIAIVRRHAKPLKQKVDPQATPQQIMEARALLGEIYADEKIEQYVVNLVMATRNPNEYGLPELQPHIEFGASPRASLALIQTARAHAFLKRRGYVAPEDVQAIALDVLRHRLILTYTAEAEDVTPEHIIKRILEKVEIP